MEKAQAAVKEIMEKSNSNEVVSMKLDLSNSQSIREFAEVINRGNHLETDSGKHLQLFFLISFDCFYRFHR